MPLNSPLTLTTTSEGSGELLAHSWRYLMTPRKEGTRAAMVVEPRVVTQLPQRILETKPQRGRLEVKYSAGGWKGRVCLLVTSLKFIPTLKPHITFTIVRASLAPGTNNRGFGFIIVGKCGVWVWRWTWDVWVRMIGILWEGGIVLGDLGLV